MQSPITPSYQNVDLRELISRQDTTERPHYIKEEGGYFLPHTHVYEWKLSMGFGVS